MSQLSGRGGATGAGTGVDGVQLYCTESREVDGGRRPKSTRRATSGAAKQRHEGPEESGEVDGGRRPESTGSSCSDSSRPEPKPSEGESTGHTAAEPARQQRPRIEPLAPERYKVQFTAGAELASKLRQAQELLRHQVPDGDLAAIIELGLDRLIESQLKKRFAIGSRKANTKRRGKESSEPSGPVADGSSTSKEQGASHEPEGAQSQRAPRRSASGEPSPSAAGPEREAPGRRDRAATGGASGGDRTVPSASASAAAGERSRYIPAAVRRRVAERDGLQCTYVGPDGRRCERRDVEFHHLTPFARGGQHRPEEIALRCRAHNAFQAELDYGAEHIGRRIRQRRACSGQRRDGGDRSAQPSAGAAE